MTYEIFSSIWIFAFDSSAGIPVLKASSRSANLIFCNSLLSGSISKSSLFEISATVLPITTPFNEYASALTSRTISPCFGVMKSFSSLWQAGRRKTSEHRNKFMGCLKYILNSRSKTHLHEEATARFVEVYRRSDTDVPLLVFLVILIRFFRAVTKQSYHYTWT